MDLATREAFLDELEKISGVGWDIHGYSVTGNQLEKTKQEASAAEAAHDAKRNAKFGKPPPYRLSKPLGFFSRVLGRVAEKYENPEYEKYWDKVREHYKKDPPPEGSHEVVAKSRISTPFDDKTNYKLNLNTDYNRKGPSSGSLDKWTTDQAYGETPVVRDLSKKDLRHIIKKYEKAVDEYGARRPGHDAFLNKARYLLKDPKTKMVRLEYE